MGANVATRGVRALVTKKYRLKTNVILPKILVCVDWFAPGYKAGGPIQSCVNFAYAMREHYQIYVLTTDRDAGDTAPYPNIRTDEWTDFDTGIKVYYSSPDKLKYANIKAILLTQKVGFIYLNSMYSVPFTIFPLLCIKNNSLVAKVILAPRGMLQAGAMQFKTLKKQVFLHLSKAFLLKNTYFHATDEQEFRDIQLRTDIAPQNITLIANYSSAKKNTDTPIAKRRQSLDCVFVSRVAPKKNILFFIDKVLSNIDTTISINLDIIGPIEDSVYWKSCENAIAKLPENIKVRYLGSIPNYLLMDYLKQSHLFVLPTLAENFGHAIWEAFLASRPVLISNQTPWRNLQARNIGWDLPLAEKNNWIAAITAAANWSQLDFDDICKNIATFAASYIDNNTNKAEYLQLFS